MATLSSSAPQPPARILALIDDPVRAARLRAAWGDRLEFFEHQPRLLAKSREAGAELVVIPVRDRLDQPLTTTVAAIRASRQGARVYVYADRTADSMRELVLLARVGARGVIVRDVDDDAASLRRLLERGSLSNAIESVALAVHEVVATRQLPLVLLCIEHVGESLDANTFARRLRVSRRTLSAWAQKTGARGVRSLASTCRVLVAIEMIRDSGRSIEHVAHALHFASSAHLHNTIRRYTGCGPRDAAKGDLASWCRALFVDPSSRGNQAASRGMADFT